MQGSNHDGTVFSEGLLLKVPTFMRLWHLDFFVDTISFFKAHTALLCLLIMRAWMYSHVFGSSELHIEHVIEGKASLPKNNCFLAFLIYWLCHNFKRHFL